jgi:hypothetical protein
MNERIRQLAEQANAWYPMGYPSGEGGDAAWENVVIFEKEDLKKFAELIVRECIDTVSDCSVEYCTRPQIVSEIKRHFGVEE